MAISFLKKYTEHLLAAAVWSIVFSFYLMTMAPTIGFIDSGELASVAVTLGSAHPTGYPLFTLLAKVFSMLPVADEPIVRLNILSALLTSLSVVVFFFLTIELLGKSEKRSWEVLPAAVVSSMFIGFSRTFWFQGLAIEVYSLHLLLVMIDMLLFVKAVQRGSKHYWLLFAFMTGLSFTNHMTTVLLAPAMLYWYFAEYGLGKPAWKKFGILALPFAAGLSLYLYLLVRASQYPLLNWGNPQSIERLWWHVTGKQFRVFMFSSAEAARRQLDYFFDNLTVEFFFPVLILAGLGAAVLLIREKRKFLFVLLLFAACVGYSINYDIHDIDSYFLLAFTAIALSSAFGIRFVLERMNGVNFRIAFLTLLLAVAAGQFYYNRERTDQSTNYLAEDYTKNILLNLPPNAVIISYQWDYFIAASYYFQHVKGIRPDITVIDKELLRRSWYFTQLEKMYPELMQRSQQEVRLFLAELEKFEHDRPYEFTVIEGRYTQMIKSFIDRSGDQPVFVTPEIEEQYTAGYFRVPEGLVFRLTKDTVYHPMKTMDFRFRDFPGTDAYSRQIKSLTKKGLLLRAGYEEFYQKGTLALDFRQKASKIPVNY